MERTDGGEGGEEQQPSQHLGKHRRDGGAIGMYFAGKKRAA
jgi:hypothetical protein